MGQKFSISFLGASVKKWGRVSYNSISHQKKINSFRLRVCDEVLNLGENAVRDLIKTTAAENGIVNYSVRSGKMGIDPYEGKGSVSISYDDLAESKTTIIVTEL